MNNKGPLCPLCDVECASACPCCGAVVFIGRAERICAHSEILKNNDLVFRLRKRAEIRRGIQSRRSVQEGKPDRIADLLDEAAVEIERLMPVVSAANEHEQSSPNCSCGVCKAVWKFCGLPGNV